MSDAFPLPPRPNRERYQKLARDLQHACKSGDPDAIRDWAARMNPSNWIGRIFGQIRMWIPAIVAVCFLAGVILPVMGGHDSLSNSSGQTAFRRR